MKAIYHGHSFVEMKIQGDDREYTILIDPFITGNPLCDVKSGDVKCDYIILTHAHGDHYGDTEEIAKNNDATVISSFEVANYAENKGLKVHHMHIGGANSFPFGKVKFTIAHHSSSFNDGTYGGNPAGVIISNNGKVVYHAGDTGLFYDMKLIGEMQKINLAFLPIGDNFTMGIDDAVKAADFIGADTIIPIHYNTFDVIKSDPQEFKKKIESIGKKSVVMSPGDDIEI
jgi:L-ascorbate metabolism protein UlaG (beta-lactamase superfamily)